MINRQRGVALITVMIIVVVATILGVQMITEQYLAVTRAKSNFDSRQVREYAFGGEELARQILHKDFADAPQKDYLGEEWARPDLAFEFDDGDVSMRIEDLQSRFNINTLALADSGGNNNLARQRFSLLVATLGLESVWVDRTIDWVDSNTAKSQLGAEDYDYLGLDRPYRTPGSPAIDTSELRLLLEMDPESFAALEPFIVALPDPSTPINVNTAPAEILKSVSEPLSLENAAGLIEVRNSGDGYASVSDFLREPGLAGTPDNDLSVQSSFFKVSVRARYRDRFAYLTSIIQRDPTDGSMRVIYRDMSKKIYPVVEESDDG